MPLTSLEVKNAVAADKPYKLADGGGLYVLVTTKGARLWRLDYRFAGKRRTLALGAFPKVGLTAARDLRTAAKDLLERGLDPTRLKNGAPAGDEGARFRVIGERWFEANKGGWAEGYAARVLARLEDDIYPEIGELDVAVIDAQVLLKAIRKIEARGSIEMARRVKNYCSKIFRFAVAEGLAARDPAHDVGAALMRPKPVKHRAALRAVELPTFLQKLESYDGLPLTRLALKFAMHTLVRTNEIRFAVRSEFEGLDGTAPLWRIPGERMKMRSEHIVPLSTQSVALLREILPLAGNGPLVFPGDAKGGAMSANTMIYALYRLGYHGRATVHGFRGMGSTILNERGFNSDWIERQLAHVERDDVRAAYNSAQWLKERREMMQWWSDYLDERAAEDDILG